MIEIKFPQRNAIVAATAAEAASVLSNASQDGWQDIVVSVCTSSYEELVEVAAESRFWGIRDSAERSGDCWKGEVAL